MQYAEQAARTVLPKRCPKCGERFPPDFVVCPRDAVELAPMDPNVDDPYLGAILGETYRIEALIAEGGMGRVYEAKHLRLPNRAFAIKILHSALVGDSELVGRFRREAEIASAVEHPNVIQVFDVHTTLNNTPYIVSERLRGEDLAQRLERDELLTVPEAVAIVRQSCAVLAAVHARGVIHRDLKPNNLFLVGDPASPTVKLIDFGIAKLRDPSDAHQTRTGMVMGTPAYMAPEQARGEKVDARADIYAVGAIAYRCVTGRAPYHFEDAAQALHAVLTAEPPRPRSINPQLPVAFEMVLQRAMARDPADRYPTLEALDAAFAGFDSLPQPVTGTQQLIAAQIADPAALAAVAQRARPEIAALSAAGLLILVGGLADALAAVFAASEALRGGAGLLSVVAAFAALATPTWLYIRFLRSQIWTNSPRAVAWSRMLGAVVGAGAAAYAATYALGRFFDLALGDGSGPSSWGRAAPFVLGVTAGVTMWSARRRVKSTRDDA